MVRALLLVSLLVALGCTGESGDASARGSPTPRRTTVAGRSPTPTASRTASPPGGTASPEPRRSATPDPGPTGSETPTPGTDPTVSPAIGEEERERLEELRATNRFLELAEAERARTATWARFGYHYFAPHADGEILFEWSNKEALWNSIAPRIRDRCLLAGPEATRPMWDAQIVIPANVDPRWNNTTTDNRGHFVEFACRYMNQDEPEELWWGVLIDAEDEPSGHVVAVSEWLLVREEDYDDFATSREGVRNVLMNWVLGQPRR